MAPSKTTVTVKIICNLDSIQTTLSKIREIYHKGDLIVIVTYATPGGDNYGICLYNLSEDLVSHFSGYGDSTSMKNGYPWVENILFLEGVKITTTNPGKYIFTFVGYPLNVGKSPLD